MAGAAWADTSRGDRALQRLSERDPEAAAGLDERARGRLAVVAGASDALADLVVASAAARDVLAGDLSPETAGTVRDRCARALAAESPAAALVAVQRLGLLRVAARDLLGVTGTAEVVGELSDLADGVVAAATDAVGGSPGGRLAVVALGKLGGRELNYVSDIDVVFAGDGELADATRGAGRLLRLLGTVTPDGRAYEVDTNLRPEGKDGPLVRSLDAYVAYWRRWAKPWEFQALLKARAVAGDAALGAALVAAAAPFVWPDRLEASAVAEIQALKGVVEESPSVRRAGARQLKLAPGGLRDIEFAVQLLQLVHGRHDGSVRSPGTFEGLAALADAGYVGRDDAAAFRDAYAFLRTVEHRLQLVRLRRTHVLPADEAGRRRLARSLGFSPETGRDELERFEAELARVQGLVRGLHAKLFYRPLLWRFAELSAADQLPFGARTGVAGAAGAGAAGEAEPGASGAGGASAGAARAGTASAGPAAVGGTSAGVGRAAEARDDQDGAGDGAGLAEDAARERLAALGFADPGGALRTLAALAGGSTRRARLLRTMLPAVLPTLAGAPDPDGGLLALRSLVERAREYPQLLRMLRDTPPVADLLARVLGSSRVVGAWLERQPEVLGALADTAGLERATSAADYRRLADGLRRRGEDPETVADALRRMRRREMARIAVRDLVGLSDVAGVGAELSGLAEACLQAAVDAVASDGLRLAVIGLGKLGGRELGYASDLDVLLVFDGQRAAAEGAAEALLRLLSGVTPEGQAFRVDANLRPEGKDGPLVRSLDSYRAYYERWAEPWELQALTQARPAAGDPALGEAFVAAVAGAVFPDRLPPEREAAMRRMKARVERERAAGKVTSPALRRMRTAAPAQRRSDAVDLKVGPGGLADVEWTVQLLQQRHGGRAPALRRPGALAGLAACVAEGVLAAEDARWLGDGWRLLARVRNALALAGHRSSHVLPAAPTDLDRVARMLGYPRPGAQALAEDVTRAMRRVRRVHERVFFGEGASRH